MKKVCSAVHHMWEFSLFPFNAFGNGGKLKTFELEDTRELLVLFRTCNF